MGMGEHLLHGEPVPDSQIQAWSDEAEAGYDVGKLPPPRRGRPSVGNGPGTVVPVRFDADTLNALADRAHAEGLATRSDAIRAAVNQWIGRYVA
ncbi:toxin-antitoxin system protein [Cutibacterium acnes]|uniref:toxin-antitoxin system protein n=1 Tax=Cutibacterium granulosum TaxID=33011 RepID=UPI002B232A5A|nr:toxin-antitoxin system protein [Cutibacterium granulosum]MEA5643463.1 toxin-antitoxin system protein [Cutibacterium granulosum]